MYRAGILYKLERYVQQMLHWCTTERAYQCRIFQKTEGHPTTIPQCAEPM